MLPLFAVSVTLPPAQRLVGPPAVMLAVGVELVMVTGASVRLQLPAFVMVTL